jgi:nicotinamide-nucleotide amidase
MDRELEGLARRLGRCLAAVDLRLVTAESCTGGWIAKVLTDRAGSSAWFDRGFVTYSNLAKREMLGVLPATLERHGAVSRETVLEMAQGAVDRSAAQYSVAVSGVAGPGGGTPDKPVGSVWIAWATPDSLEAVCERFDGDRERVRMQTVERALQGLLERL